MNSVALRLVPAFATVTGPAHTFATVPASLFPNNRVLFRTIFHSACYYTYALVLYCCALYSLGREINNIPSVKPQGEKAPWRINAMWGYSWIRLEFKMGRPADSSMPAWARIPTRKLHGGITNRRTHTPWNTHTARALRLKQLKCDFVHLKGKYTHKHKRPPTHFDWHDLVTADYTLRQRHECSANLCYPPTEGMAGTTAAQEGGCISPHALEGAERCISCQAASNHALPRVLQWQ